VFATKCYFSVVKPMESSSVRNLYHFARVCMSLYRTVRRSVHNLSPYRAHLTSRCDETCMEHDTNCMGTLANCSSLIYFYSPYQLSSMESAHHERCIEISKSLKYLQKRALIYRYFSENSVIFHPFLPILQVFQVFR